MVCRLENWLLSQMQLWRRSSQMTVHDMELYELEKQSYFFARTLRNVVVIARTCNNNKWMIYIYFSIIREPVDRFR